MKEEQSFNLLLDRALSELSENSTEEALNIKLPSHDIGSYSKNELAQFLAEIEEEDDSLTRTELDLVKPIEEDKLNDECNQIAEDLENDTSKWYTKNASRLRKEYPNLLSGQQKLRESLSNWRKEQDALKLEISRWAFDQKELPLNETFGPDKKKLMIEILTKPVRTLIERYEKHINNRVTRLLRPAIPTAIKIAQLKWPWVFIQNPGFLYTTDRRNGDIKTFWVTPDVPYFFKQGTEQEILEERDLELQYCVLDTLDRVIHRWYNARTTLAMREVQYAQKLLYIKGNTYYHLLLLNPLWFKKLYDEITSTK